MCVTLQARTGGENAGDGPKSSCATELLVEAQKWVNGEEREKRPRVIITAIKIQTRRGRRFKRGVIKESLIQSGDDNKKGGKRASGSGQTVYLYLMQQ